MHVLGYIYGDITFPVLNHANIIESISDESRSTSSSVVWVNQMLSD